MTRIGLDVGTGFVKCVSDYGQFRFPSLYARRINGAWTDSVSEAVGEKATQMLRTRGTTAISPICRGRPEKRYREQVEMLVTESVRRVYDMASRAPSPSAPGRARVVVGLPYEAAHYKDAMAGMIRGVPDVESCDVVAQAAGTLVSMGRRSGLVVSIGQGTSEIILIEENRVIDGQSLEWASEFITRKIGRYAHLDENLLRRHRDVCARYAGALAENLATEVAGMASAHGHSGEIVASGGGILIPRVRQELAKGLRGFKIVVPGDPVMSNALGLYRLAA